MNFVRVGGLEAIGRAFRARVQWKDKGIFRRSYGPWRAERQIAQNDLDSMRAAASGLGRDEGYAAIDSQARLLFEKKPTAQKGAVEQIDDGFRAHVQWLEEGTNRQAHGPRRRRWLNDVWHHMRQHALGGRAQETTYVAGSPASG